MDSETRGNVRFVRAEEIGHLSYYVTSLPFCFDIRLYPAKYGTTLFVPGGDIGPHATCEEIQEVVRSWWGT